MISPTIIIDYLFQVKLIFTFLYSYKHEIKFLFVKKDSSKYLNLQILYLNIFFFVFDHVCNFKYFFLTSQSKTFHLCFTQKKFAL